ncbi:protein aurora borealis [Orycteropus afer afer]|uniref:Protein aurora borealis n=1 Tax=Orycteropus afer afer TaxID=1230840 RepID=A0A8B7AG94_ORYAF|nr:protein aurora borealis [Orycteropus afer afer]
MGDAKESKMQITPETPGRIPVLNPFESPSDYSNLHEQTLSSPSVFKSTKLPTPGKFRWSIDQLAVINPVEIDPEDIHRQALYLSHSRIDKDVEDKRQKAIEEFFTKDVIVPSPWTNEGKQLSEYHSSKCININSESPIGRKLTVHSEKSNAACQTLLSLPVDFNLENILGDYFRADELADQSPENLSSSSLRRKLFLDGNGSISDSLSPASPRSPHSGTQASLEVFYSIDLSPVQCKSPAQTPSSAQFSSSPIQENGKKYSLGSIASHSPISSPTLSPIAFQIGKAPLSEQRKLAFHSPDASSGTNSNGITNTHIGSPYIDGCSSIKNWSPMRLEMCRGGAQYRTSLIRIPFTLEAHSEDEDKENAPPTNVSLPAMDTAGVQLRQLNNDAFSHGTHLVVTAMSITQNQSSASEKELALLQDVESEKENNTVDMVDPVEIADDNTFHLKEAVDNGNLPMTDFMSGIAFSIENSHMCMLPLAESSVIPCENSNIQMDSGYNTQHYGSNIMDTVGAESYCKESDAQICEAETKSQVLNTKQDHITQRCWKTTAKPSQCSSP